MSHSCSTLTPIALNTTVFFVSDPIGFLNTVARGRSVTIAAPNTREAAMIGSPKASRMLKGATTCHLCCDRTSIRALRIVHVFLDNAWVPLNTSEREHQAAHNWVAHANALKTHDDQFRENAAALGLLALAANYLG
jgi:hypothetical protein